VLVQHEGISEAVVIGVPDEKWGEVGKAFVVKKAEVGADEVIGFCKEKLAKFKVPKYVVFVEELPKNDTGKIDRKSLKNQLS
jgi:acyl-CoA synthetase (AMP-forming)/AMP-acid ligase II